MSRVTTLERVHVPESVASLADWLAGGQGMSRGRVVLADNLQVLAQLPDESVDLIYVDPPFNTGKRQTLQSMRTVRDQDGDRVGFQGRRYRTVKLATSSYLDVWDDYFAFLEPRLRQFNRALKRTAALYFHIDTTALHYCN